MNIPRGAFLDRRGLPHLADSRRSIGNIHSGGRDDGTGYIIQTIQEPVICADDIIARRSSIGKRSDYVTNEPANVRCKDCLARMTPWAI